jgi:hypothetical protein
MCTACRAARQPHPTLDCPPLKMVQISGAALSEGIEQMGIDEVTLLVYGVVKTVADCFKHRNKVGLNVALEALREALVHDKATVDELWRFPEICCVANVIRPYLEVLVGTQFIFNRGD